MATKELINEQGVVVNTIDVDPTVQFTPPAGLTLRDPVVDTTPVTPTKDQLIAFAKSARYNKEMGGLTWNGHAIDTSDRSKLLINGAFNDSQNTPGWTSIWQASDGSAFTINADDIKAISLAVAAHVNQCFMTFATVAQQIVGSATTTFDQITQAFA